jgi:hypothetical protein
VLNLTGRRDGSSRFGPDHRWGNFGAIGAAWIFSEENFMKRFSFLSFGKLRSSYGVTGSDQVDNYKYLSTYEYLTYTYQDRISLEPTGLSNSSFAWEQTTKFEAALELGFIKNRVRLELEVYRNRCANQLLQYQLPAITGYSGVTQNLDAVVENKGLEFSLQTININRINFQWQSSFNFTLPYNKLVSYPGLAESPYANTYVVGEPLTIVKLFHYIGVNPSTGLYEVRDINGDGNISNEKDRYIVQNIARRYYGGLNNTLRYKGIELSFLLQFSQQTSYNIVFFRPGEGPYNFPQEVVGNYWQQKGDLATYQKATTDYSDGSKEFANASNAAYTSSSFIRLKTLSLSYSLPTFLLNKTRLKSGKLYIQGQNLATISSFKALDPEGRVTTLPPIQIITAGLEIKL